VNAMTEEQKKFVLEEYKKTVDIAICEGTIYWQRFNVLFAVNAAILVFLGVIIGNHIADSQSESAQRILVFGACAIGFVSSISMVFGCLRSQAFHRFWWKHIEKLEKEVLKDFSLMKDLDSFFKKQSFVRQIPVLTLSIITPFTFSVLFGILPVLLYGQVANLYMCFDAVTIALLLFSCAYSAWRKSWENGK
jgi:hypothetical protein